MGLSLFDFKQLLDNSRTIVQWDRRTGLSCSRRRGGDVSDCWWEIWKQGPEKYTWYIFRPDRLLSKYEPFHSWKTARYCQDDNRKILKNSAESLTCAVIDFRFKWGLSAYFHGGKLILSNFSSLRGSTPKVSFPEVQISKETEIGLEKT